MEKEPVKVLTIKCCKLLLLLLLLRPNKKILSFLVTRLTHVKKLLDQNVFFLTKNASRVHFSLFVQLMQVPGGWYQYCFDY